MVGKLFYFLLLLDFIATQKKNIVAARALFIVRSWTFEKLPSTISSAFFVFLLDITIKLEPITKRKKEKWKREGDRIIVETLGLENFWMPT